jgi:hypothetical protein
MARQHIGETYNKETKIKIERQSIEVTRTHIIQRVVRATITGRMSQ